MLGLVEEARILLAHVAELKEASKKKASKVRLKCRTADMRVIAGKKQTLRAEHIAWIA